MATQGPLYPATVTTEIGPSGDNDWLTPANIGADDAAEAQITAATFDDLDHSYRLKAQNFGFTIPISTTIDGIVVEIDRRTILGGARDQEVRLYDAAGLLVGTDKATATAWPTTTAVATYGGATDLWGTTWTPAAINDIDFGVALIAAVTANNTDIGVDFIRVTVYYTDGPLTVSPGALDLALTPIAPTISVAGGTTCALVVANSAAPTTTDAAIKARIEALGHTVTYVSDEAAADLTRDFVVIAESCVSTNVAAKYSTFAGGVLALEPAVVDDMDMATVGPNQTTAQTQIVVLNAAHALAAGLSGTVTVFTAGSTVGFSGSAEPAASATSILSTLASSAQWAEYAYESGATMLNTHVAEGRRVFLGIAFDAFMGNLNADGLALLDAAITWVAPASAPTVSPSAVALALAAVAPARFDLGVSPGALALALDAPAPSVLTNVDPAAIALSLGIVSPARIDVDLSPGAVALTLSPQTPARVDQDTSLGAVALALATLAPDFLAIVDPAALALALTALAPGRIDQDASPSAIALTVGNPAVSVEAIVEPAATGLVLGLVSPARIDLEVSPPVVALTLSPQTPTRIDFDVAVSAQGLVLTPVAPTRLDQDAILDAIAIAFDVPAPVVDSAGALIVTPGLITLLLTPEAPRADLDAGLAPIALTVGLETPAFEFGVGVGALSLTLIPEAPIRIDQQALAQVLSMALGILAPSLEAFVEPDALAISLGVPAPTLTVIVTASDGSIRMVSVPLAMGRASSMIGGSSMRIMPGAMTGTEPTTRPD